MIVGRFVGKEALSCVSGSSGQIINLVVGFFTGLSAGATVMISQHFGAKNEEQLHKALHTAYAFAIAGGEWHEKSGLPLKKFFNTSGLLYKEMKLKDRLPEMSGDEQLKLLATNGMLVKRPLIVDGSTVITGFKEKEWSEHFL